jgi:threonylcarbamoyladenosine tRNA methylthiotransferase MtaB
MKVKFFTLGCKVNQYETQGLMEQFLSLGHTITKSKADLYVINTCTVTARADSKSKDAIIKAKKENPGAKIAVCGCLAQHNSDFIEKLGVDYIVPQDKKQYLTDIVLNNGSGSPFPVFAGTSFVEDDKRDIWSLKISKFSNWRAFVKVQDGCDNFCSFCKIPSIRGRSISRNRKDIIDEIRRLSRIHHEIVLCGVNLGLYGRDLGPRQHIDSLIEEILDINSLTRLRLSSFQPDLITDKLLSLFSHPKLCPHLHLPFQNGDDSVLKDMNKTETVAIYEGVVGNARKINPLIAISCDIMVNFPSENEQSFSNTVSFLKRIAPMRIHIFTFSPREKTRFCELKSKYQKGSRERFNYLQQLADEFALDYKSKFLNKTLYMVAEEKKKGYTWGYTENYINLSVRGNLPLGEIVPVRIIKVEKEKVAVEIDTGC